MAAIAAPPFVSFSSLTEVEIPAAQWPTVYSSLQALKGHVQEYPEQKEDKEKMKKRGCR